MSILSRRSILLGVFALVVATPAITTLGLAASTPSSPVAACQPGYVMQPTSGACVQGGNANAPKTIPGNPSIPEVDGIPCTGANSGQCIGLQESQGGG